MKFKTSLVVNVDSTPTQDVASNHDRHSKPSSYADILYSTILIGGSSVLTVALSIVRVKATAVLLGPAGFGLMAVYTSIADLARSVAGMGINSSGVRQIAEAAASGQPDSIARTVSVLRGTAVVLGVVGAVALSLLAAPVSRWTFGSVEHTGAVALVSLAVLFKLISDGQGALLQGMRRVADMAKSSVYGSALGVVVGVALVYWYREDGVALSVVAISAASMLVTWWYSRRVTIQRQRFATEQLRGEALALLRLGAAFMASGVLTMGTAYVVRIILVRDGGLEAAGLYQSAWTIGGLYVGLILQAMGADFYPRLVAVYKDDAECCRLVNEQAQVSLLLGGCGVIATLAFAPEIVKLLYSADFEAGTDVLRWITLGMAMRMITWPLGYILIAKGKQALFVAADTAWAVVNLALTWLCVDLFGLVGAGMAFLGSYVVHLLVVYPLARHVAGFRWSATNLRTGALFVFVVAGVFVAFQFLDPTKAMVAGAVAMAASLLYSFQVLRTLVEPGCVPRRLSWLVAKPAARGDRLDASAGPSSR